MNNILTHLVSEVQHDMGSFNIKHVSQSHKSNVIRKLVTVPPEATSYIRTADTLVRIRVKPGMLADSSSCRLRLQITETLGVNPATTFPATRLIRNLAISLNGSEDRDIEISRDMLSDLQVFHSQNEFTMLADEMNYSSVDGAAATFLSATNIPAGGSKYFYINLDTTILNKINYNSINRDVTVSFNLQPTLVTGGLGNLEYTNCQLEFQVSHDPISANKIVMMGKVKPFKILYFDTKTETQPAITLTANETADIPMRSVTDINSIPLLTVRVRTADTLAQSENMVNLNDATFDIKASTGDSLIGKARLGTDLTGLEIHQMGSHLSRYARTKHIYPFVFGDIKKIGPSLIHLPVHTGGVHFSTSEVLSIRCQPGFATGNYVVQTTAYVLRAVQLFQGEFSKCTV